MSIEINSSQGRPSSDIGGSRAASEKPQQGSSDKAASTSAAADSVNLTDQTARLQALEKSISELPVVNTQRVEQVQNALATGTFQIDPARVADKLLSFEAGLAKEA